MNNMIKFGIIGAICLGISGSVNAGTLDKIKDAGAVLLEKRSEKENGGMKSDMMKFDPSKIYLNFGLTEYKVEHSNDFEMSTDNWTGRIGYQIDDIFSVEFDMAKNKDPYVVNNNHEPYYTWNDKGIFVKANLATEETFRPFVKLGVVQTRQFYNSDHIDLSPWYDGSHDEDIEAFTVNVKDRNLSVGFGAEYDLTDNFGLRWDTQWVKFDKHNFYGEKVGGTRKHIKSGLSAVYRF